MGTVALAAKITHVPSMYLSELPGPRQGTRQDAIDGHHVIAARRVEIVHRLIGRRCTWLRRRGFHIGSFSDIVRYHPAARAGTGRVRPCLPP
jgi:3,4-dihydroxyphenylacetate 2,3-dioxygenase